MVSVRNSLTAFRPCERRLSTKQISFGRLSRHPVALCQSLGVPEGDGKSRGYRCRNHRLRPLRRKVRRVSEDITDECRYRADRRLPTDAVTGSVHLYQETNGNRRANNPTNRGETRVLETERREKITTCHDEKAREPRSCELFDSRTRKTIRP